VLSSILLDGLSRLYRGRIGYRCRPGRWRREGGRGVDQYDEIVAAAATITTGSPKNIPIRDARACSPASAPTARSISTNEFSRTWAAGRRECRPRATVGWTITPRQLKKTLESHRWRSVRRWPRPRRCVRLVDGAKLPRPTMATLPSGARRTAHVDRGPDQHRAAGPACRVRFFLFFFF